MRSGSRADFLGWTVILLGMSYLIGPTLLVIWQSFGTETVLRFPPELFSLRWYDEFLFDPYWNAAVVRTLLVGGLATAISVIAGFGAALAVARSCLPGKRWIELFAIAPIVVPPIILASGGYSMFTAFGMIGSNLGLAVLHAVLGTPYVYLIISASLRRADPNAELAALSVGARRWQVLRDVTVPTHMPAILIGALFAFLVSFDEVILTVFLSGSLTPTLPVRVYSSLSLAVSPVIAAVSTVQVFVALIFLGQLALLERWNERRSMATKKEA
jgi:ABC-type spermidine/putrescine transport system permease subunit II